MSDSRSLTILRLEAQCHNRQGCGLDTALTRAEVAPASSGKLALQQEPDQDVSHGFHVRSAWSYFIHLPAYPARCPAIRRHSSMNFSTSLGSNLKGLLPAPILTAGRYGLRLPAACWMT